MGRPKKIALVSKERLEQAAEVRRAVEEATALRDAALAQRESLARALQADGMAWAEIGQLFGVARQGLQRRVGTENPRPARSVPKQRDPGRSVV